MSHVTKPKIPNFHRQRFLLVLLELSGGRLSKMDFQKLLFLSQVEAEFPYYDFVPYLYGCYSFQAQSDIELLESRGWLRAVGNEIELLEKSAAKMEHDELTKISDFAKERLTYRDFKLVHYVYERYPYYAINSKMAEKTLEPRSYEAVVQMKEKIKSEAESLFTIGYEGLSVEKYINQLIRHDVHLVCDVRKNPLSRKFWFSKDMLSRMLPKFGIEYVHIPELGIASESRRNLEAESDYAQLFKVYKETLPRKKEGLKKLFGLFENYKRVALTCFEKQHDLCHRHCISEYMEGTMGIEVVHL